MELHVTQEHIDKGIPYDGDHCAVALAVKDHFAGNREYGDCDVYVTNTSINLYGRYSTVIYRIPPCHVRDWIKAFDRGENVEPIIIHLNDVFISELL